jgi:hypothetical protein
MYGQKFKNFAQNVRTTAGIGPKCQILFGLPIRPQNATNLFGLAHQASKKPKFVRTGPSGLKKIPNMFGLASKIAGSLSDDSQQCQSILSQPILGGEGHLEHRN